MCKVVHRIDAPFFTNQLELVRNTAKSLPIGYKLYVKEHPIQKTKSWTEKEQSGIQGAGEHILKDLEESNRLYEEKFGYIFIVCATGKSAEEMLILLKVRLENDPEAELLIAAKEQNKITQLRLENLLSL